MKRTKVVSITLFSALICTCLYCPVFHAMPKFMDRYDVDVYAKAENKGRCRVCHTNDEGFGPLNKFGQAFADNGYRISDKLRQQIPEAFAPRPAEVAQFEPKFDVKVFYTSNCAVCHGQNGKGGDGGRNTMMVPNFTDAEWQGRSSDEKLGNTISNGKGMMPSFKEKMNPEQIKSMVAYIRSFSDQK